jgi:N6-adenosine-specific RNA methylase IME4
MADVRYRTIVADPPWHYGKSGRLHSFKIRDDAGHMPYATMSVEEITALPVEALAQDDAHLYVWTTQKYLRSTFAVVEAWGFRYSKLLTWCKPPTGFTMGDAYGNASEFILFARRGSLAVQDRVPRDWFEWPRKGGHSAKPEAFLDLVEQVSPGPYLELFARRDRLGWDTWGNESLGTAEVAA